MKEQVIALSVDGGTGVAYLSTKPSDRLVFLDAAKFVQAWGLVDDRIRGGRRAWVSDRKYPQAEVGFSVGRRSPVPLPEVGIGLVVPGSIVFTNGITRTLWLLAHDAPVIPVDAGASEAALIQLAGADPATVAKSVRIVEQAHYALRDGAWPKRADDYHALGKPHGHIVSMTESEVAWETQCYCFSRGRCEQKAVAWFFEANDPLRYGWKPACADCAEPSAAT